MYQQMGTKIEVLEDILAVVIPDGVKTTLKKGSIIYIQQVLGGMFTVQTEEGFLLRIDGKNASAIGQTMPKECTLISKKEIEEKGLEYFVNEQLKTCYDPEIPVNIIDLGLIYKMETKKDLDNENEYIIHIEMTLTAPGCGMGEILKSDVEEKLKNIPYVKYVLVDLVFDPAWDSSMMSETAKLQLGFL